MAAYGITGAAGADYVLQESGGTWSILSGPGKDMFAVDMLPTIIPKGVANQLEGADCPSRWFFGPQSDWMKYRGVRPGRPSWHVTTPVQPPIETVSVEHDGKLVPVHIVRSGDVLVCAP